MQPSMMRLVLACLAFGACAADDDGGGSGLPDDLDVIASGPASGTISGTPFTVGTRFMNVSGSDLYVDLLPVAAADCTLDETDGRYPFIIFFVPPTPGRYPLGFSSRTVTFVDAPSNNLVVSDGVIEIEAITATTVTGGLHVFNSEFGEVNGRFDGTLCFSNP
ncbi:MAG: hypothetical protein H0T42_12740 [Deltaproteobacteria bacterium]|nr:hypothetical protein [Deltaproteobacteria bacterium]